MLLSCRFLDNVSDANGFTYLQAAQWTEGDSPLLYFQLVDLTKDKPEDGFVPGGRRYMPVLGASLSVTFDNVDSAKVVTRAASQPFPDLDPSIWAVQVQPTDKIRGTCNFRLQLSEGGVIKRGLVKGGVLVSPQRGF